MGRSFEVARALAKSTSNEIIFICIRLDGAKIIIPDFFPYYKLSTEDYGGKRFADKLEGLVSQLNPGLICLDMTPIPWLVNIRFPKIPLVYLTNFFLTNVCQYKTRQNQFFSKSEITINKSRQQRGLMPIQDIKSLYSKDAVLLCDPPGLINSTVSRLPENYHAVGPCAWEPEFNLPEELEELVDLLFISFGSTGSRPFSRRRAEEIAGAVNAKTIIWVGKEQGHHNEQKGSKEHIVYPFLPVSKLLSRSRFVVTHGGAGSTYQAVINGCPTGVWPNHINQELLGRVLQNYGCGLILNDGVESNMTRLKNILPDIQSKSRAISEGLNEVNGPLNAANIIIDMMG